MLEDDFKKTLEDLNAAVEALGLPRSLSILSISEDLLNLPETTRGYVKRYDAWNHLQNIAKSIPDLIHQSDSIALVGFLGHFSSGKSSLINALLDITDSENASYKREVGRHPTDTGITLITHQDHENLVKNSRYTTIDKIDVVCGPNSDFLRHATLVDTPGLGNEDAEHDIVTRFLHLCHVLVITIDGRRPFADKNKDFELLDIAFNKLADIPKILVVTSAEEFLISRTADFETGWQEHESDGFWREAVERLRDDSRFQDHINVFEDTPRVFVDSKEGFRISQVRERILPIVQDNAQRSRARQAQYRYVLETSTESLNVLLSYISERSDKFDRLLNDAQQRAEETNTAVKEILESLERSFLRAKNELREFRKNIPDSNFDFYSNLIMRAASENQNPIIQRSEKRIRNALEKQTSDARNDTWNRVISYYKARTRPIFSNTKNDLRADKLISLSIDIDSSEKNLISNAIKNAKKILRSTHQQHMVLLKELIRYLEDGKESAQILFVTGSIRIALDNFQDTHDDSIRSFCSYFATPTSRDLLQEHIDVKYNELEKQDDEPESIRALEYQQFKQILKNSRICREKLQKLRQNEPEDLDELINLDSDWISEETQFNDNLGYYLENHIRVIYRRRIENFISHISEYTDFSVKNLEEEKSLSTNSNRQNLKKAFKDIVDLVKSLALFIVIISVGIFTIDILLNYFISAGIFRPYNLHMSVIGNLIAIAIAALVPYMFFDLKRRNVIKMIASAWSVMKSVLPAIYSSFRKKKNKEFAAKLEKEFNASYDILISDLGNMQFTLDQAIATGTLKWLREKSSSFEKDEFMRKNIHAAISSRSEILDTFISTLDNHLEEIPRDLDSNSERIKGHAIEKYISKIQKEAESVRKVRGDVEKAVAIARRLFQ
ncbi:MAG: 50S ribosome-binding GTPase [Thiotrichales bacterium]|nr:50S ribosome-binding GTPase [Thiotrichales bacterium]